MSKRKEKRRIRLRDEWRAEMLLQNEGHRAAQTGLSIRIRWNDPCAGVGKRVLPDGFFHDWTDAMPGARNLTDDDKDFRRQACDEHGNPNSQIMRHLLKRFARLRVTLFGQPQNIAEPDSCHIAF